MFRIIEQEQKNPELMLKSMLDYVNSFASTSLDVAGLKLTIDTLSPLSNFEFQKNYFDNQNSALYYRTAFDAAWAFSLGSGGTRQASFPGAGSLHRLRLEAIFGPIFSIRLVSVSLVWARSATARYCFIRSATCSLASRPEGRLV
jgi:hypothetical protein